MRIYNNAKEMVREVERDLYEMGVRYQSATVQDQNVADDPAYETLELLAYQYSLKDVREESLVPLVRYSGGNLDWARAEAQERIDGSVNPGYAWTRDRAKWEPFIRDGRFAYHYPERLSYQIEAVIWELTQRPNTRQATISMYDVHQDLMNWGGRDRVPCSLTYHFILRNGLLTLIYHQRSCDFLKFFATDVYITCALLRYVGARIAVSEENCQFIHVVDSLHAFKRDLDKKGVF